MHDEPEYRREQTGKDPEGNSGGKEGVKFSAEPKTLLSLFKILQLTQQYVPTMLQS